MSRSLPLGRRCSCGVLALAGRSKLRLTPALLRGEPEAGWHLRGAIRAEAARVAVVLPGTAALTTLSAPPHAESARQVPLMTVAVQASPTVDMRIASM